MEAAQRGARHEGEAGDNSDWQKTQEGGWQGGSTGGSEASLETRRGRAGDSMGTKKKNGRRTEKRNGTEDGNGRAGRPINMQHLQIIPDLSRGTHCMQ